MSIVFFNNTCTLDALRFETMATPYLRLSRARHNYTCEICLKMIKPGVPYFRDEPHPMARRHRGAKARYLCTNCAVGRDPTDFKEPADEFPKQLDLPFDKAAESYWKMSRKLQWYQIMNCYNTRVKKIIVS